jgi:hypothetical protein
MYLLCWVVIYLNTWIILVCVTQHLPLLCNALLLLVVAKAMRRADAALDVTTAALSLEVCHSQIMTQIPPGCKCLCLTAGVLHYE